MNRKRKRVGRVPIGCVSLCDVLNELASFESSEPFVPKSEGVEEGYLEDEEDEENESDYLEEVEAGRRKRLQPKKKVKKTKSTTKTPSDSRMREEGGDLVDRTPASSATAK